MEFTEEQLKDMRAIEKQIRENAKKSFKQLTEERRKQEIIELNEKHTQNYIQRVSNLNWNMNISVHNIEDHAKAILDVNPLYYDDNKIWWRWNINKWEEVLEHHIIQFVKDFFEAQGLSKGGQRATLLNALKDETANRKPIEPSQNWLQCDNIIIDITNGERITPDPKYFVKTVIPLKLGDTEDCPTIDKLFTDWQPEEKQVLYDIMAYMISPTQFLDVIFFLVGTGANGKGIFQDIMNVMIGSENITTNTLEKLSDPTARFQTADLENKLVCKLGDANYSLITSTGFLKQLSGRTDLIPAEKKGGKLYKFINKAKIIGGYNTVPDSIDKTRGWYRRTHITEFKREFDCKEDVFSKIPKKEFNNLLLKSVNRLLEIYNEKTLYGWGTVEDRKEKYERLSNPVKQFILKEMVEDVNGYFTQTKFHEEYKKFAHKKGYNHFTFKECIKRLDEQALEKIRKDVYITQDGYVFGKRTELEKYGYFIDECEKIKHKVYCGYRFKNDVKEFIETIDPDERNKIKEVIIKKFKKDKNSCQNIEDLLSLFRNENTNKVIEVLDYLKEKSMLIEPKRGIFEMV